MTSANIYEELQLLRAAQYAAVEPWAVLQALRDPTGRVIDFTYRDINPVAAWHQRREREALIGRSVAETLPEVKRVGLIERYAHCVETGEPLVLDDFPYTGNPLEGNTVQLRRYEIRGARIDSDHLALTWRDTNQRYLTHHQLAESEERYRLLVENSSDVIAHFRNSFVVWVSPTVETKLGAPQQYWMTQPVERIVIAEDLPVFADLLEQTATGATVVRRLRLRRPDGVVHWVEVHAKTFYDAAGNPDGRTASLRVIDTEVAAEQELADARRGKAKADALYARVMDSAPVGTCLADLEGNFIEVNPALCEFFGYDADTLRQMMWQELTDPDYLEADLAKRAEILAGTAESYRMTKKFIHADGHPIWGDLSVSCVRAADQQVEIFIGQIIDITEERQARDELTASERRNLALVEDLQSELRSAARYIRTVMPPDLDGPVSVSSRYLPSKTLGGDCFDFRWVDDDHLVFDMLDVSGHGVESALIAVSVHNILRSASVNVDVLLEPDHVLAMLNSQFEMEHHDNNYFTIFYGVYQPSTATLRYASAGHPPALLITGAQLAELSSQSPPVGFFNDTAFYATTVQVAPGSHLLIGSDGTFGFPLRDGGWSTQKEFVNLCASLAGLPDWSLDDLIDKLRGASAAADFVDDCSLLKLTFGE